MKPIFLTAQLGLLSILAHVCTGSSAEEGTIQRLESLPFRGAYFIPSDNRQRIDITVIVESSESSNPYGEGLPHFVEHLIWLRTKEDRGKNYGGHSNAFTSSSNTRYEFSSSQSEVRKSILLVKNLFEPLVSNEFMESERQIVLQEYNRSMDLSPLNEVLQRQRSSLYEGTPLERTIIGTLGSIKEFRFEEASTLHQNTHFAENSTILIFGNSDLANILNEAQGVFGEGSGRNVVPKEGFDIDLSNQKNIRSLVSSSIATPLLIYSKLVGIPSRRGTQDEVSSILVSQLIQEYLNSGLDGSFVKTMVFDRFMASKVNVSAKYIDANYYELSILLIPSNDIESSSLIHQIDELILNLSEVGISDSAFQRIKGRVVRRIENLPDPTSLVKTFAISLIEQGIEPVSYNEVLNAARRLKSADTRRIIHSLGTNSRVAVQSINFVKENNL